MTTDEKGWSCACGGVCDWDGGRHWWALVCPDCGYSTRRFGTKAEAEKAHKSHGSRVAEMEKKIANYEKWLALGADNCDMICGRGLTAEECARILGRAST